MTIKQVNPLKPLSERRRFGRINISEPRICHVHLPQSQELWTDQGILVNISLGGVYLICNRPPPLEKDDIRYLTFDTAQQYPGGHHFGFHALVVRTEQAQLDLPQFAVGLRIISNPIYYALQGTSEEKLTSLDKTRILYQYYDLNKKAYEIIANTPEMRTDRIINLKKFIDKGSYKIKPEKVTRSVILDLFLEKSLHLRI
jgi:anti-sigma28 factor (negative regulator of flagellin synthesis)